MVHNTTYTSWHSSLTFLLVIDSSTSPNDGPKNRYEKLESRISMLFLCRRLFATLTARARCRRTGGNVAPEGKADREQPR